MTELAIRTALPRRGMSRAEKKIILASSLGSIFELYDFFLAAVLATEIANTFFSGLGPTLAYIAALLGFATGFVLRPFGALVFGRVGDMLGRKYAFLATIILMGICTFVIGLLPSYGAIGIAAPILFLAMRLLQGLALGGEFAGAMIYVAEHAPDNRRAYWVSWVMLTGGVGMLSSLLVVLLTRHLLGEAAFEAWGWRVPFLLSMVLLLSSVWMRLKLHESPAFQSMKESGSLSRKPITETFCKARNLKLVAIALLGIVSGQVAVQYTGLVYTLFFLHKTLKLQDLTADGLIIGATLLTAPCYVLFGRLADKIGRKPLFLAGVACSCLFSMTAFRGITHYANPALEQAQQRAGIVLSADPADCSVLFSPTGTAKYTHSCDIVRDKLSRAGLSYRSVDAPAGTVATIALGGRRVTAYDGASADAAAQSKRFDAALKSALDARESAVGADAAPEPNYAMAMLMLMLPFFFATMTFAAAATMLVELFPSRIRYTAMSFPFHTGTAIFGGFMPAIAFAIVATTGNPLAGLYYPATVEVVSFILVLLFVRETRGIALDTVC